MQTGSKLKSFRIEKGLSPIQVADVVGISESTYRRYEADKTYPDINVIDKIARLFEKPISYFFQEESQQNHQQSVGSSIAQAYGSTVNQLSDKLIEMYEERIKDLNQQLDYWKSKANN
ncbi:MAG: helix-turn-helix domain-containing protein [Flavobacteriales bacterium]|nr:helix-turn-helix domain-containing protein [Flavobacteriales bacterium]MCW8913063.1 helix-turn-helix domain-containing protein [Flavobacteriales bacterium]MCW8938406.1 helix-turn-helix domain-containing protein [Flavobacteriales bacterium]MCW8939501.1 helix-turn-helix domain-containing protein [Flavobacteriales bacterium]MCW8967637.1 helix-turn-helix domain-containing protein [Flavobacteriales bacterium]